MCHKANLPLVISNIDAPKAEGTETGTDKAENDEEGDDDDDADDTPAAGNILTFSMLTRPVAYFLSLLKGSGEKKKKKKKKKKAASATATSGVR